MKKLLTIIIFSSIAVNCFGQAVKSPDQIKEEKRISDSTAKKIKQDYLDSVRLEKQRNDSIELQKKLDAEEYITHNDMAAAGDWLKENISKGEWDRSLNALLLYGDAIIRIARERKNKTKK